MPDNSNWQSLGACLKSLRKDHILPSDILGDGWRTPNTYSKLFGELGDFPAVYAIVLYDKDCWSKREITFRIAYIGMSKRLSLRFAQHDALSIIINTGQYYQIWFKRTEPDSLRQFERELIRRYDPPLNIIGKKVSLN